MWVGHSQWTYEIEEIYIDIHSRNEMEKNFTLYNGSVKLQSAIFSS